MGLYRVWKGAGQGSIFGNGRFCGVHNPLGSDLGKASDPYINLRTLSKLSHSKYPEVATAAAKTLALRIETGFNPNYLYSFDRNVLITALAKVRQIGSFNIASALTGKADIFEICVLNLINSASTEQLSQLANSQAYVVRRLLANNVKTPTPILMKLADDKINCVAFEAFKTIEHSLQPAELAAFANSDNLQIREKVAENPNTPRSALLTLALNSEWPREAFLAFNNLESGLTADELSMLAGSSHDYQLLCVAKNPKTPRNALLDLALTGIPKLPKKSGINEFNHKRDMVALEAYNNLSTGGRFSAEELSLLAGTVEPRIRLSVAADQTTPKLVLIKLALSLDSDEATAKAAYLNLADKQAFNAELLDCLANSVHESIINLVIENRETNKETLLLLAQKGKTNAFNRIAATLNAFEIEQIAKLTNSNEITKMIPLLPAAPSQTIASIISSSTPKSRKVIDQEAVSHEVESEDTYMDFRGRIKNSTVTNTVTDVPEKSHYEYAEIDLDHPLEILSAHPSKKQEEILAELRELNPELAKALSSKINQRTS
ncbi:MAG: hypothetical protein WCT39_06360 [Candidatus Margulisiibacteriota bacterium]